MHFFIQLCISLLTYIKITIYQQEKGIAIGSPISSTIAEIYVKYLENIYIKHWLDSKEILFYKRCVDDTLIAYDQEKIDEQAILQRINEIEKKEVLSKVF